MLAPNCLNFFTEQFPKNFPQNEIPKNLYVMGQTLFRSLQWLKQGREDVYKIRFLSSLVTPAICNAVEACATFNLCDVINATCWLDESFVIADAKPLIIYSDLLSVNTDLNTNLIYYLLCMLTQGSTFDILIVR